MANSFFELIGLQNAIRVGTSNPGSSFLITNCLELGSGAQELSELLRHQRWYREDIRLVKDSESVPASSLQHEDGSADMDAVWDAFSGGATIVLHSLEKRIPRLSKLCRDIGITVGGIAWVNAYISPPGGSAFAPHTDDHNVLVQQIFGSKQWEVCDNTFCEHHLHGSVSDRASQLQLVVGDVLFLPKGIIHSARAGDSMSIHLSIGFRRTRWGELLNEIAGSVDGLWSDPISWPGEDAHEANIERVLEIVRCQVHRLSRSRMQKTGDHAGMSRMEGAILASAQIHNQMLRGVIGQSFRLCEEAGRVSLRNGRREIIVPALFEDMLKTLLDGGEISLDKLGEILDSSAIRKIVSVLVGEGIAVISPD